MASFENVKIGDIVTRKMGPVVHDLLVGEIKDGIIYAGSTTPSPIGGIEVGSTKDEGAWGFRVENGAEVDEDLGWDGITTTGSFLIKDE